ncbi:T6SS phospholipase effector Tle1-like catalytic domain-containing protein [Sorangium sp. So ce1389]|uniref:T6SS phospholipase effector Tle1-like catalytic domain-containing protein n=1 Tax=Sorangium sp. So ce1389 TaxID=3133336 RepID=UPI003F5D5C57
MKGKSIDANEPLAGGPPAHARASFNQMSASALPNAPPSGTERCPAGRIRIGVFFDGTGNNMFVDWPRKKPSNVAKLFKLYRREGTVQTSAYHIGVGSEVKPGAVSQTTENVLGGAAGLGGRKRIDWGREQLNEFFNRGKNHLAVEKIIDVYGFSRGAALARDFVNAVKKFRVNNTHAAPRTAYVMAGHARVPVKVYPPLGGLKVWFLGIFDTVGSFTVAGKDLDVEYDFNVDAGWVAWTTHLIAEDERRSFFSLQSIQGKSAWRRLMNRVGGEEPLPRNMEEIPYPGAHADVGGGYAPGDQGKLVHLAHIPLRDMHARSKEKKVPLLPLSSLPAAFTVIPGDLLVAYNRYRSDRAPILGKRYIQALANDEYKELSVVRAMLRSWMYLKAKYIHDQLDEFGPTTFLDRPLDKLNRLSDWLDNPIDNLVAWRDGKPRPPVRQRSVYFNASRSK